MDYELIYDTRNSWSSTQETLLKKWYKEAMALNWKHTKAARNFFFIDRLIGIPTVATNAVMGTAVFLNLDTKGQCENNLYIQAGIGTVIILTAIFMAIQNFLRLAEIGEKHNSSSARYKNFANSIESELVLPREERLNGKIFIKQAQKRFNELFEICPNIPQNVEKDYKKYIKNVDALECGNLLDVIINEQKVVRDISPDTDNDTDNDADSDSNSDNEHADDDDSDDGTLQREVENEIKRMKVEENKIKLKKYNSFRTIDKFVNYF